MNTSMHGKQIAAIWFPGDGNSCNERIEADGGITLELSATYHGDRDEFWVVEKLNGEEIARHNPKVISTIRWKQPEKPEGA